MMHVNWKKWISVMILAVFLCGIFAGCAKNEESVREQEKTKNAELDVWVFFDINTPGSYYVDLWDTLGEEYGYSINVNVYSTEQIKDKLRVALVCNELPDIFLVWGGKYPDYLFDAGACVPVQEYLEQADFEYKDSYVKPYRDGNNYIIPCLVEAYAVTYCNNDLMDEIGLEIPESWEELVAFVEKVNAYNESNGTDYAALNLGDKDSWLGELLYCMIVNRMDPYAFDRLETGEAEFSDEVFVEAAKKVRQLVDMGAFPDDYMETGEVEAVENFINQESVLFPHQSTIVYYLMQNMGEDSIQMVQFPSCSEEYDQDYASYMMDINHTLTPGLCISSQTPYQDAAAKLCLEFAKRVNEINVTEYGYLNMTKEDLTLPDNLPVAVQQFHDMVDHAQKITAYWDAELPKEEGNNWKNLTKKLFAGELDVEEFIEESKLYLKFDN